VTKPAVANEQIDPIQLEQQANAARFHKALARRNFLKNVGLAGAGIAAGSMLQGCLGGGTVSSQTVAQPDVLNFALNLEYLEAEFYNRAVTGNFLPASVTGGSGQITGGQKVTFATPRIADIAQQILNDEIAHVKLLRSALGSAAVPEPNINLAALGIGFANENEFLNLSRALEDTGVSAYSGAATLLSDANLQAAAQILATEAYHAGNIRDNVIQRSIAAAKTDSLDVLPDEAHFFAVDSNGLAIKRTPSQVLAIVYAKATPGTNSGGFFPNGVNGNIKTV